ncbi:hypothetical protein [Streptomyces buecherae]|uniref:hypothetical protein n=1 Tax=Streptomyces buecherae TaxID=2763006 RepID=UPI0036C71F44
MPQAVVVSAVDGLPRRAPHVVRDARVPLGWRVTPLDLGAGVEPAEVVVVRHPPRCVALDTAGALHTCALAPDGGFGPARRLSADDGTRWEALRCDGEGLAYARQGVGRYCLIREGEAREAEFDDAGPGGGLLADVELGDGRYVCAAWARPTDAYPVRVEWRGADGTPGGSVRLADEEGRRARQVVALYPDGGAVMVLVANRDGSFSCARLDGRAGGEGRLAPTPVAVEFADVVPHRGREPRRGRVRLPGRVRAGRGAAVVGDPREPVDAGALAATGPHRLGGRPVRRHRPGGRRAGHRAVHLSPGRPAAATGRPAGAYAQVALRRGAPGRHRR